MAVPSHNSLSPRQPYCLVSETEHGTVCKIYSANDINLHDHRSETQSSNVGLVALSFPDYTRICTNDVFLRRDNLRAREDEVSKTTRKDAPASGRNKRFRKKDKQATTRLRTSFVIHYTILSTLLSSVSGAILRWLTWKSKDFSCKATSVEGCADQESDNTCNHHYHVYSTGKHGTEKLCYTESEQVKEWNSGCHVSLSSSCQRDKLYGKGMGDYEDVPNNKSSGCSADDPFDLAWLFMSRQFRPVGVSAAVYPVGGQKTDQAPGTGDTQQPPRDRIASAPTGNRYKLPDIIYDLPRVMFSKELNRLGTFFNLPSDMPVFAIRLAHVGFLCLPDGAIVCYFCELRHDEWHAGDSPFEVHRRLCPNCPIVTGRADDNQLVSVLPLEQVRQVMDLWSISGPPVLPNELGQQATTAGRAGSVPEATPSGARASSLSPEEVNPNRSSSVSSTAHSSNSGPRSSAIHTTHVSTSQPPRQLLQNARLMDATTDGPSLRTSTAGQSGGNSTATTSINGSGQGTQGPIVDGTAQPLTTSISSEPSSSSATAASTSSSGQQRQIVTYQNLGIITEAPKRRDMASIGARIESFENWTSRTHTPHELAQAGFFYAGYGDCARCFYCGGGLKNWEWGDNPWAEHARWFKTCPYVRVCQGQDFIDVVQQLNVSGRQIGMAQVQEAIELRRAEGERIQELVVDPAVSSLLETGVSRQAVDSAVQRVQREGHLVTAYQLVIDLQTEGLMPLMDNDAASAISVNNVQEEIDQIVSESSEMRQQRMCKVCLDKESCIVFLPCGHLVCCAECSPVLVFCAVCRIKIQGRVRAFPGGA